MATLAQIRTKVMRYIRQTEGLSTSPYVDALLSDMIYHKLVAIHENRFWERHCVYETYALNGTSGLLDPLCDFVNKIGTINNVQYIWLEGYKNPLTKAPDRINPDVINMPVYQPIYTDLKNVFKILPVTTTGNVTTRYRTVLPAEYQDDDEIPFDMLALVFGTVYDYFVDEAANEKSAQKYLGFYNARIETLKKNETPAEVSMYDPTSTLNTVWRDM